MNLTLALDRIDLGPMAVPIDVTPPGRWTSEEAREFLFTMQRLLGGGNIRAIRLHWQVLGVVVEVVGVGGRITSPPLRPSSAGLQRLQSAEFELPNVEGT